MKIPKRFKLMGFTIEVAENPELLHRDDCWGLALYRDNRIEIQPSGGQNPFPESHREQTFCHELTHWLFHMAGYPEDRKDEIKVERMSNLVYQAITTMEFD